MKWLFIIALWPMTCMGSQWIYPEIGVGSNRYTPQSDGIWYQKGMQHHLGLRGTVYMIGVEGSIWRDDHFGLDWHVDYANLGHIRSTCLCTPRDQNYDVRTHSLVPHPVPMPNAEYTGRGGVQGVMMTANPYASWGDYRMGMQIGLFPYRPDWRESVYGWATSYDMPKRDGIHAMPFTMQWGRVAGLSIGKGAFTLTYDHFWLPTRFNDTHLPTLWTQADVLFLTWSF